MPNLFPKLKSLGRSWLVIYIIFIGPWLISSPAFSASDPIDQNSTVSATIPTATAAPSSDTQPPSIPILIRPADGSISADNTPEFAWYQASDPNSNYVAYTLYLNGVATFLGVSNDGNGLGNGYTSFIESGEVRLTPLSPLPDGIYSWRLEAFDISGNTSSSATWHFTIDTTPPPIVITGVGTHHNLNLNSTDPSSVPPGTTFQVAGPGDIYFNLTTETYTNLQLTLTTPDGQPYLSLTGATGNFNDLILYSYLPIGQYLVNVSATDHVGLVSLLPVFQLEIFAPQIIIPLPGVSPPPIVVIPPTLYNLPSTIYNYPATISRISTRVDLSFLLLILLALAIMLLLVSFLKRSNLTLLDSREILDQQLTITHSYPDPLDPTKLLTEAYIYPDRARLRLYLPHLGRLSTIRVDSTYLHYQLCLTANKRHYYLTLA